MTEIKGQYLYNLKTGQTIGRNKDDVKTSEDKNQYSVNGVKHNWETYQLLNDISNVIDYDYGTVEDLRLSQIVQLFAQGDMTVDELQIGLKSKKIADINITENNGITTVTFTYEGKKYTLKCSTDAAKSQIDDVKDDATKNVTIEGGTTTPATPDSRALSQEEFEAKKNNSNFYNYNGEKRSISIGNVAWVTYSDKNQPDGVYGASLPKLDIDVYASELENTPEYMEDSAHDICAQWSYLADLTVQICDKLGIEYTDRHDSYEAIFDQNRLTKEQGQYINSHPEEFFGMKINYDENGEYQGIYLGAYYDLYCYSKYTQNSDFMNIKDVYWSQVDKFSKSLQMNQGTNLMTTPECDGNTVTFTDESIEMIKEMLMKGRGFDNEHHAYNKNEYGFVQLLGLNQNSSEEEIRQKIADFCYKAGSTDGKTILVEDYYNALAVAKVGISGGSLSNIDLEIPLTYDEISRNINNALYLKIEECEKLGIDISDLGITKPSQFIKINASEAFNETGLMNGGVKDERYSNRFYNDDVTKLEDPWINVPEDYKSPDGDTSGVGYYVYQLKEKYPDIYEKFKDIFPEYGNGHGQSRSINICITNNRYSDNQDFRKLLMYAAGVSESEINSIYMNSDAQKINEKVATALGGIVDGPYITSDIEFDVIDLMNYLLGKNDTGTNYFYASGIVQPQTNNTVNVTSNDGVQDYTNYSNVFEASVSLPTDSSVKYVDDIDKTVRANGEFNNSDIRNEIYDYMRELIDPIYQDYFRGSPESYVNFNHDYEACTKDGNDIYSPYEYVWKDEETKQAFVKEVETAIQKVLDKYSDVLSSMTFDGRRISFTTKDDSTYTGAPFVNGDIVNGGRFRNVGDYEPALKTPKTYLAPSVIANNVPDNAPVIKDDNGNDLSLYKTPWEGVLVDKNNTLYLWDSANSRYINAGTVNAVELANGNIDALKNIISDFSTGANFINGSEYAVTGGSEYEVARVLINLVYGYNLTSSPCIFEKDGKYYQFDERKDTNLDSEYGRITPETFISLLTEIEFADGVTETATQGKTSNTQPEPEVTVVDTPDVPTAEIPVPEVEQPVTPTVAVEEKTITKEEKEEVIIKSEDIVSEMQTAAEKLNLTAAKTTGTYYQFSNQGSYLYVWNPKTKKFKAFSINTRNADGTINQEFTQTGKAVNRTEANVYYEALLEAYKNGYNFTVNYPWVCEKDGVYYEYDKEAGCFKKRTD